jgi:hypothetical protein
MNDETPAAGGERERRWRLALGGEDDALSADDARPLPGATLPAGGSEAT